MGRPLSRTRLLEVRSGDRARHSVRENWKYEELSALNAGRYSGEIRRRMGHKQVPFIQY